MKDMTLKEIVTCAVNGLEAGVDTKQEAVASILAFIDQNYTENNQLEELPVEIYEITDGSGDKVKIAGVKLETIAC